MAEQRTSLSLADYRGLTAARVREPGRLRLALTARRRRPLVGDDGRMLLIAADHTARGKLAVGSDPMAAADRFTLLDRIVTGLADPRVDGVLASWAVPRGPSLDPAARQLAVHVEDHPLEYAGFEGVIPRGQYGGGDVIVWDRGTWTPAHTDDPAAAIAAGELQFDLAGEQQTKTKTALEYFAGQLKAAENSAAPR